MSDKATFAVQVDRDSELFEDFEEYKEAGGFESRSEVLRYLMRQEFYENPDKVTVEQMRDELEDLRDRQRTPLEEAGYLLAAVMAGTSPLAMIYWSGTFSTPLAFAGGLAVAFLGLLVGAVTKIVADNQLRADGASVAVSGVSE